MNPKELSKESSSGYQREDEWSEVTRGERYIIRTTSEEANGAYSMLEVIADPRNGVPMRKSTSLFWRVKRSSRMETVERRSVPAHPSPSAEAYLMPGAILPKTLPSVCWCSSPPGDSKNCSEEMPGLNLST
jgi:hypothetical protein